VFHRLEVDSRPWLQVSSNMAKRATAPAYS
jgi:hypothetical protein